MQQHYGKSIIDRRESRLRRNKQLSSFAEVLSSVESEGLVKVGR